MTELEIKNIIERHRPSIAPLLPNLRPASVMALFYPQPDGLSLIFTKRTDHLEQHSGQISFPGGAEDEADADALSAALRETNEEIGVDPGDVDVWGRLNQQATITGYSVAPFVGSIPYPYDFRLSADEVERLIIVPLAHLLNPETRRVAYFPYNGRQYKNYEFPYNGDVIWGATGRMVNSLITLLTTGSEPPPLT